MVIQCEQCRTKFKLDDNKISDRGVKVRCAKCRHVFTVQKAAVAAPAFVEPTVADDAQDLAFESNSFGEVSFQPEQSPDSFAFGSSTPEADADDIGGDATYIDFGDAAPLPAPVTASANLFDFGAVVVSKTEHTDTLSAADFGDFGMVSAPKVTAVAVDNSSFDFSDAFEGSQSDAGFDFGSSPAASSQSGMTFDFGPVSSAGATVPSGDVDFGGFDFGDAGTASVASPAMADFGNLGMAKDAAAPADMDFSFDAAPVSQSVGSGSFDLSGVDFGAAATAPAASSQNANDFSLGDFDLAPESAAVAGQSAKSGQSGASLFDPLASAKTAPQPDTDFSFTPQSQQHDDSPLSIPSRRRQGSFVSILIGLVVVLVIGVGGFFGYLFMTDSSKAMKLVGKSAPVEEGRITVQNVKAGFIPKGAAGELLVITGEAVNGFKTPRAALQLKAVVYGANGEILAQKNAFAGNLLTEKQLSTMTAEKIDTAMSNQFGDSLINMGVAPGKSVPFTIVIVNPPAAAKDFAVEAAGSTVAAAK
jgi:predicted Zn finger-like uncharacterized protein